jgi:four helix bundle protein
LAVFDFEKLEVYTLVRQTTRDVLYFLAIEKRKVDLVLLDQLRRAAISVPLNLAEGSGHMSRADKKHFYTVAQSSTYECVAILQLLLDQRSLSEARYQEFYDAFEQISRMLLGLIRSLQS